MVKRVTDFDKANPGQSTRTVAEALGVGVGTVHRARHASPVPGGTPDDRPTIDKPPKGALWDDQAAINAGFDF